MKEPTEAQSKEFWERRGLIYKDVVGYHGWYKGIGGAIGLEWVADNLPIDLNNLFKYAVPSLLEEYNIESYSFKQGSNYYYSETNIWKKGKTKQYAHLVEPQSCAKHFEQGADLDKITALALFWAIYEVIDE